MADIFTVQKKSEIMSKISGKDTKQEVLVRKFLFSKGFRFRKNDKRFPGSPDIVLPKYRTMIFIHGCFWHGHDNCKIFKMPKTRTEYWENKINKNIARDLRNENILQSMNWHLITIWECQLGKLFKQTLESVIQEIKTTQAS